MVGLDIEIDPTRAVQGAQRIGAELQKLGDQAGRTTQTTANLGRSLSSAFQVTSGGIGLAGAVASTASAMGQLNSAATAMNGARVLLEIGRIGQDFRELRTQVGGAGGVFSTLGSILRAHPLLAIASVISLAATAMAAFGSNTGSATEQIRQQASELDRLRQGLARTESLARLGGQDPRRTAGGLRDVLATIDTSGQQTFQIRDAARLLGVSEQDLRYSLYRGGMGEDALAVRSRRFGDNPFGPEYPYATNQVSRDQLLGAGRDMLGRMDQAPRPTPGIGGATTETGQAMLFGFGRARAALNEQNRRDMEEAAMRLAEMQQAARGIGESLGAGAADMLMGLRSAKEVIAGIAADLLRAGLARSFGNLGASMFGSTPAQQGGGGYVPGSAGGMVPQG